MGGSLKHSLGMASPASTIPKAFGFEAATQCVFTGWKPVPRFTVILQV